MNEHEKFNRRKRCLELLEHRQRALYLDGDFVIGEVKPESHNANSTTELQWDIEGIRRLIGYHKVLNEYRDTIEFCHEYQLILTPTEDGWEVGQLNQIPMKGTDIVEAVNTYRKKYNLFN